MPQNEMIFFFEISKLLTKHLIKWFHESSEQLFFRQARNERGEGGGGEVSPSLFGKLEKSALVWRKNAMIVVIYV